MSTSRTSPQKFLKHASTIASFYGFRPAREVEKLARAGAKRAERAAPVRGAYSFDSTAAIAASYVALHPLEPALAFYATPAPHFPPPHHSAREVGEFGLQVVGSQESVGEVVLLKTIAAIVSEWGARLERVRVNAMGDKDSQQRFARELSFHVRKHQNALDEACRPRAAGNPMALYACTHETCRAMLAEGPRPMNFLSEKSRTHFRLVLEHLENLGLPYELDDLLAGDARDPHFSFALDIAGEDGTLISAQGGRYDDYFRRETGRRESAGVAASVFFRKKGADRSTFAVKQSEAKPKIYFVQLGTRAKLQGLVVVDMLRAARLPVSQSFDATHLSPQLSAARDLGVSHMLIMGQREALDGTIIVRSTRNSSQVIMQLSQLPRFLKTLH